jgi:hypothetical protein
MTLSVASISYITPNSKLMYITLENDMADIGHGLVSSVILTNAKRHKENKTPAELETL